MTSTTTRLEATLAPCGRQTTGERIVTEGLQKVREGAVVQPMTAAQMAEAAAQAKQAEPKHAESKQAEPKPAKE